MTQIHRTLSSALPALALVILNLHSPAAAQLPMVDSLKAMMRGRPASTTIVLVDGSGSIDPADRSLYRASLANAGRSLHAGDRLLVAPIGDGTRASFRPLLDLRVPSSKIQLERDKYQQAARREVTAALPRLVPEAPSPERSTRILEAVAASARALPPLPRQGSQRIVILSDGVEESPTANLDRKAMSEADIAQALKRARADGLLPDLRGVSLAMVGVGGRNYAANERWWAAYARATGARLVQYNRLALEARE